MAFKTAKIVDNPKPGMLGVFLLSAPIILVSSQSSASDPVEGATHDPTQESIVVTPSEAQTEESVLDEAVLEDPYELDDAVDLLFEDFDIVISASRSEQSANLTPVPVSIISAEDIRYSGVSELPELFMLIPGVDALQLDRNRWAIGVRGLHQTFSDRTLFLLNGRTISNPVHGGVDFQRMPIFLDDIKQIETVRGPGGAAWGANAFNGVINIIEKDPRDTAGVLISQRVNEFGDSRTNFRVGQAEKKFAWRFSAELNNVDPTSTTNIISGTTIAPAIPNDFLRSQRYDFDGVYDLDTDTSLDFGIGGTHVERGDSPFLGLQVNLDERIDLVRAHAKISRDFSDESTGYVQWYGTYQDVDRPSMFRYNAYDNTIDSQITLDPVQDHKFTFGGSLRTIHMNIDQNQTTDALPAGYTSEQWFGVFGSDNWTLNDDWILESQLRVDWYSETSVDWSGRFALLRSFGENNKHVLRIAAAKAFRTPQTALRDLSSQRLPLGGGLFGVNLIPAFDVDNEQLYSLELGYTGRLADGVTFRADTYMQHYDDLTGVILLPEPAPAVGRSFFTIDNIGSANAVGAETELKYQNEKSTLSLWYAYNDFDFSATTQNARAFRPARHKVGASARTKISDWLVLNANYRFTDITEGDTSGTVPAFHRIDLTATILIPDINLEIQFGVLDLLDETDLSIVDQTSTSISQETPGQRFFVQLHSSF